MTTAPSNTSFCSNVPHVESSTPPENSDFVVGLFSDLSSKKLMAQEIFSIFLQAATAGIVQVNGLTTTSSRNVSLQNDVLWENSALLSLANILVETTLV